MNVAERQKYPFRTLWNVCYNFIYLNYLYIMNSRLRKNVFRALSAYVALSISQDVQYYAIPCIKKLARDRKKSKLFFKPVHTSHVKKHSQA